jgi:hypothetical protein
VEAEAEAAGRGVDGIIVLGGKVLMDEVLMGGLGVNALMRGAMFATSSTRRMDLTKFAIFLKFAKKTRLY